jgi:hypothetical protein
MSNPDPARIEASRTLLLTRIAAALERLGHTDVGRLAAHMMAGGTIPMTRWDLEIVGRMMEGRSQPEQPAAPRDAWAAKVLPETARIEEVQETKPRPGWTAREAFACAYCWSEFASPEDRMDSPETYWLHITERARNECRAIANDILLLAVARGEATAIPRSANFRAGQFDSLKTELGMKLDHRVRQIYDAVFRVFKRDGNAATRALRKKEDV